MKINGGISINVRDKNTVLRIEDDNAGITLCVIEIPNSQFLRTLSGLSHVDCSIEVGKLEYIGKEMIHKVIEFPLPDCSFINQKEIARKYVFEYLKENDMGEWIPDMYFGSQKSFFIKDKKRFASCTIRKWISQ